MLDEEWAIQLFPVITVGSDGRILKPDSVRCVQDEKLDKLLLTVVETL